MQQLIFGPPLFYDIPEYLQIVSDGSFWQVFSLGHFPIHPVFLGIFWILIKIIPVNAIAMFLGTISVFIIYKISKLIFKKGLIFLPVVIFALFPAVWLINTNLMVESVTLVFYLAGVYFFLSQKKMMFFISLILMIGTHLQSIVWIPTIFLFPGILDLKFKKNELVKFVKYALFATFVSVVFYCCLYFLSGRTMEGTTEQLSVYFSSGIMRMIRNSWLSFIRDFGSLTPLILLFLIIKNAKSNISRISWIIFFGLVGIIGANWQGDFMGRRIVFAGVLPALSIYKYIGKKSVLMILYLLPIVVANIILYSGGSPFAVPQIPTGQILIETHYLKPFTKYEGTVLWTGQNDFGKIDEYLASGKRVFLTKQAITAPYMLLVGNNYHITSLGRVGESESRFLFKKYIVEEFENVTELKLFKGKEISKEAGKPVIFYDQSYWGRLARRRIDYGDLGSWIWAIVTNHRDSMGWTYVDVRGKYVDLFSS